MRTSKRPVWGGPIKLLNRSAEQSGAANNRFRLTHFGALAAWISI
jgi:hypothetical protein